MSVSRGLVIGYDYTSEKDTTVLVVGEQKNGVMNIINAFEGDDAKKIYELLTTEKGTLPIKKQQSSFVKEDDYDK